MTSKSRILSSTAIALGLMMAIGSGSAFAAGEGGVSNTGVPNNASSPGVQPPPAQASSVTPTVTHPRRIVRRHTTATTASASTGVSGNNPADSTVTGASSNAKGSPNSGVTSVPGAPQAGSPNGGGGSK